jgi:hypothetical protein
MELYMLHASGLGTAHSEAAGITRFPFLSLLLIGNKESHLHIIHATICAAAQTQHSTHQVPYTLLVKRKLSAPRRMRTNTVEQRHKLEGHVYTGLNIKHSQRWVTHPIKQSTHHLQTSSTRGLSTAASLSTTAQAHPAAARPPVTTTITCWTLPVRRYRPVHLGHTSTSHHSSARCALHAHTLLYMRQIPVAPSGPQPLQAPYS